MSFDTGVYRQDPEHIYYNKKGVALRSVSAALALVSEPFDGKMVAKNSAFSRIKKKGDRITTRNVEIMTNEILKEWKDKGDAAAKRGTIFHEEMEAFVLNGVHKEGGFHKTLVEKVYMECLAKFHRVHAEIIVSDGETIAGTADVIAMEGKKSTMLHLRDYKTNAKGLHNEYEYEKKMKYPVDFLIQNDYMKYALQQSIYGYLLTLMGYTIGSINLIWIDIPNCDYRLVPVPFMYHEAKSIVQYCKTIQG